MTFLGEPNLLPLLIILNILGCADSYYMQCTTSLNNDDNEEVAINLIKMASSSSYNKSL